MPIPGKRWYHVTFNTLGSWLPGDPRGFRSRQHRIHSSGDYKHRPPAGEHAGLHKRQQDRSQPAVVIPEDARQVGGIAIVRKAVEQDHRLLAVAVGALHAHALAELPDHRLTAKRIVGTWKQAASHAMRQSLPGKVWGRSSDTKPIRDQPHQLNVFDYILRHADEGAWVWEYRMPLPWEGEGST